jgi:hypothetical protein
VMNKDTHIASNVRRRCRDPLTCRRIVASSCRRPDQAAARPPSRCSF